MTHSSGDRGFGAILRVGDEHNYNYVKVSTQRTKESDGRWWIKIGAVGDRVNQELEKIARQVLRHSVEDGVASWAANSGETIHFYSKAHHDRCLELLQDFYRCYGRTLADEVEVYLTNGLMTQPPNRAYFLFGSFLTGKTSIIDQLAPESGRELWTPRINGSKLTTEFFTTGYQHLVATSETKSGLPIGDLIYDLERIVLERDVLIDFNPSGARNSKWCFKVPDWVHFIVPAIIDVEELIRRNEKRTPGKTQKAYYKTAKESFYRQTNLHRGKLKRQFGIPRLRFLQPGTEREDAEQVHNIVRRG